MVSRALERTRNLQGLSPEERATRAMREVILAQRTLELLTPWFQSSVWYCMNVANASSVANAPSVTSKVNVTRPNTPTSDQP